MEPPITVDRLREIVRYDPDSGVFRWLEPSIYKPFLKGTVAGCRQLTGYLSIRIDRKSYLAHRLAWFYMTGCWPREQIDHINSVRDDNRFSNLREASRSNQMHNRRAHRDCASGTKGVYWHTRLGKWHVQICVRKKKIHIGYFDKLEEAAAAYAEAAKRYHGEFARTK